MQNRIEYLRQAFGLVVHMDNGSTQGLLPLLCPITQLYIFKKKKRKFDKKIEFGRKKKYKRKRTLITVDFVQQIYDKNYKNHIKSTKMIIMLSKTKFFAKIHLYG